WTTDRTLRFCLTPIAAPSAGGPRPPPGTRGRTSLAAGYVAGSAGPPARPPRTASAPDPRARRPTRGPGPQRPSALAVRTAATTPGTNRTRDHGWSRRADERSAAFPTAPCRRGPPAPPATAV